MRASRTCGGGTARQVLTLVADIGTRLQGVSLRDDTVREGARRMRLRRWRPRSLPHLADLAHERDEQGRLDDRPAHAAGLGGLVLLTASEPSVSPRQLTEAMTWLTTALGIGIAIGSAMSGRAVDEWDSLVTFGLGAGCAALGALSAIALYRRLRQLPAPEPAPEREPERAPQTERQPAEQVS